MSTKIWGWDKKPRTMDRYIKRGDIFCFRYDDTRYCFGRIIERVPKIGDVVEIFDYITNNPSIDENAIEKSHRIISPIFIDPYGLFDRKSEGEWRIIGHQEDYKAPDYDDIYLTFGLDGDWKKKDLYGNVTRIPDEEHYNYILETLNGDHNVKSLLKDIFGDSVKKGGLEEMEETNKNISVTDYLNIIETPYSTDIYLDVENPKVMAIGEEMNNRCSEAYMNGYNWDAFLQAYIYQENPDILNAMETDPEAGLYCAIFDGEDEETRTLAKSFAEIIKEAIENEEVIYDFLEKNKDEIEWD